MHLRRRLLIYNDDDYEADEGDDESIQRRPLHMCNDGEASSMTPTTKLQRSRTICDNNGAYTTAVNVRRRLVMYDDDQACAVMTTILLRLLRAYGVKTACAATATRKRRRRQRFDGDS